MNEHISESEYTVVDHDKGESGLRGRNCKRKLG